MRWHCMCFKQKMFFAMKNLNNEIYTGKLHKRRHLVSCLSFYFFIQPRFFHLYSGFISSPLPPLPPPRFFLSFNQAYSFFPTFPFYSSMLSLFCSLLLLLFCISHSLGIQLPYSHGFSSSVASCFDVLVF